MVNDVYELERLDLHQKLYVDSGRPVLTDELRPEACRVDAVSGQA